MLATSEGGKRDGDGGVKGTLAEPQGPRGRERELFRMQVFFFFWYILYLVGDSDWNASGRLAAGHAWNC